MENDVDKVIQFYVRSVISILRDWEIMAEEEKKQNEKDVQKESALQPITKTNSKLDKELQEWEVESTKGGANEGGG